MHILSVLFRILSIGSLLIVLVGVLFIGGGIVSAISGEFGVMLRALFAGVVIVLLGLAAFVGLWALADRVNP